MKEFPVPLYVPDDNARESKLDQWTKNLDTKTVELGEEADADHLSYVAACACGAWHLVVWPKDDPAQRWAGKFKCRSWRHEGDCRKWKGAQDFVRVKEAMQSRGFWSHVVLTFEQPKGSDPHQMYVAGVRKWSKLRKRIIREYGDLKYIQTWERHRSGFPHVHLAVSNRRLFDSANSDPVSNFRDLLFMHATECGFGPQGWLERLRSAAALAVYLTRLARELTGKGKDYQTPVNAPKNFRRLRASVRLLPPIHKNPDVTGFIKFYRLPG